MARVKDDTSATPKQQATAKKNPDEFEVSVCDDCMLYTGLNPCGAQYTMRPAGMFRLLNGDVPRVQFCAEDCKLEHVKYEQAGEKITFKPERITVTRR